MRGRAICDWCKGDRDPGRYTEVETEYEDGSTTVDHVCKACIDAWDRWIERRASE